ncbi:hypothetical protein QMQ05_05775 [Glutamicibacter ectropisis]|uniref:HK97 gp10 family phage protein n=1 Tax=Glutamicibacter ectropisis TaxID=3046593 RepID=A0AAU6WH75_9MICC
MSGNEPQIEFDTKNLRATLLRVKEEQGPRMLRNLRRNLRSVGDGIIAGQRQELSGPLPGVAVRTGKKIVRVKPRNGRKAYLRTINVYDAREARRSRSTNLRASIKQNLKTRVVAGKTRSGIRIEAAKTPSKTSGKKYDMAKVWNKKTFRHPAFGNRRGDWVTQYGQPYWWKPIAKGSKQAAAQAEKAINDALNGKG